MKIKNIFPSFTDLKFALSSAALFALAFPAAPFYLLIFVCLVPFLVRLQTKETLLAKCRFTYLTFFFASLFTLYWVGSWQPQADPFLIIGGIALIFVNPAIFMIPIILLHYAGKNKSKEYYIFTLPFFWVFYEYIYSVTDFRFPWLMLSNALPYFRTFIQIADLFGAYGLTFIIVLINVLLYFAVLNFNENRKNTVKYMLLAFAIFISVIIYGTYRIGTYQTGNNKVKITVVQPNLNPWDKWTSMNVGQLANNYIAQSQAAIANKSDMVVWPETALPVYLFSEENVGVVKKLRKFVDTNKINLLSGMPHFKIFTPDEQLPKYYKRSIAGYDYATYNSSMLFEPNNLNVKFYGKTMLVPFGEKVPYVESLPFLGDWIRWNVGISSWNEGENQTIFRITKNKRKYFFASVICFESVFPEYISKFFSYGAGALFIVTNDSWYGNSSGPYQHKAIAILRAVENKKPVVRCANGGVSCYITPTGEVKYQTQMFEKATLTFDVPFDYSETFFTRNPLLLPFMSIGVVLAVIMRSVTFGYKSRLLRKLEK